MRTVLAKPTTLEFGVALLSGFYNAYVMERDRCEALRDVDEQRCISTVVTRYLR